MITLELVTLSGVKFGEEVYEVLLPTADGQIAIFPHHMPLVSLASPGVISVRRREKDSDAAMEHFATNGGVIEINDRRVRVLVDEADDSSEVVEKEAQAALELARKEAVEAKDKVSLDKATQLIQTQQARLRIAELKKRRR
jgi:F-type H+-transporting ATPase subunit epsilon